MASVTREVFILCLKFSSFADSVLLRISITLFRRLVYDPAVVNVLVLHVVDGGLVHVVTTTVESVVDVDGDLAHEVATVDADGGSVAIVTTVDVDGGPAHVVATVDADGGLVALVDIVDLDGGPVAIVTTVDGGPAHAVAMVDADGGLVALVAEGGSVVATVDVTCVEADGAVPRNACSIALYSASQASRMKLWVLLNWLHSLIAATG